MSRATGLQVAEERAGVAREGLEPVQRQPGLGSRRSAGSGRSRRARRRARRARGRCGWSRRSRRPAPGRGRSAPRRRRRCCGRRRAAPPPAARRVPSTSLASSENGPRLPSASFRSRPRPSTAIPEFFIQSWKAWRVSSSRALKISSIWTCSTTWRRSRWPPSGIGSAASSPLSVETSTRLVVRRRRIVDRVAVAVELRAGGELDVGLAEQRLLAQDRPARPRRSARTRGRSPSSAAGRVAVLGQLEVLDLADRDAADPDVGLLLRA